MVKRASQATPSTVRKQATVSERHTRRVTLVSPGAAAARQQAQPVTAVPTMAGSQPHIAGLRGAE
jgi:hypothetical protein